MFISCMFSFKADKCSVVKSSRSEYARVQGVTETTRSRPRPVGRVVQAARQGVEDYQQRAHVVRNAES